MKTKIREGKRNEMRREQYTGKRMNERKSKGEGAMEWSNKRNREGNERAIKE